MKLPTCFIYGLFDAITGKCLYVGRTRNPAVRHRTHVSKQTTNGRGFTFRILKRVKFGRDLKAESKMIWHYTKLGEAKLNRSGYKTLQAKEDHEAFLSSLTESRYANFSFEGNHSPANKGPAGKQKRDHARLR